MSDTSTSGRHCWSTASASGAERHVRTAAPGSVRIADASSRAFGSSSTTSHNELEVKVQAIDEVRLMAGFQKVANRITLGLVLAALIIGAAMLMRVETSFRILGYPGLAIILFLLAAGGGIALLLSILFKDE